jgi:hypothetical protein
LLLLRVVCGTSFGAFSNGSCGDDFKLDLLFYRFVVVELKA